MRPISSCPKSNWGEIPRSVIMTDSYPQVALDAVEITGHIGSRERVDDPAMLYHVVTVRQLGGKAEVLLHEKDRESALFELADHHSDLLHDHRGQSFGRLVEQQEIGAGPQDACDREHLLFAA